MKEVLRSRFTVETLKLREGKWQAKATLLVTTKAEMGMCLWILDPVLLAFLSLSCPHWANAINTWIHEALSARLSSVLNSWAFDHCFEQHDLEMPSDVYFTQICGENDLCFSGNEQTPVECLEAGCCSVHEGRVCPCSSRVPCTPVVYLAPPSPETCWLGGFSSSGPVEGDSPVNTAELGSHRVLGSGSCPRTSCLRLGCPRSRSSASM